MTKFINLTITLLVYFTSNLFVNGQSGGFPASDLIISDDVNVRSITVTNTSKGENTSYFKLGERIKVGFDDLDADKKNYYYSIERYNHMWKKCDVFENDYLDGFNEVLINDFKYSFNTLVKYTHYNFTFPNNQFRITRSGNYLLKVFLKGSEEASFVRRIVIYENIAPVAARIKRAEIVKRMDQAQQLDISISIKNLQIVNPNDEISVSILQNNDWNNAIYDLKQQYISGSNLIYKQNDKLIFDAGNTFFHFDNKSIRIADVFTDYIDLQEIYHTYLYAVIPRYERAYSFNEDYDGGFIIRNVDGRNSDIEADYSFVHFTFEYPNLYPEKSYYIYGAFNDYKLEEENRLKFDKRSNNFKTEILLKQGYYDYKVVAFDNKKNKLDLNFISGSFYQNENNYTIFVYFKGVNDRMERVVGFYNDKSNSNL